MAKYTATEKEGALKIFASQGATKAHRQTGVPQRTLYSWASAAGLVDKKIKRTEKANKATSINNQSRREKIKEKMLLRADQLLDRMVKKQVDFKGHLATKVTYPHPPAKDCQALAIAVATLIDKYRIENGESPPSSAQPTGGEQDHGQIAPYREALELAGKEEWKDEKCGG